MDRDLRIREHIWKVGTLTQILTFK